MNHIFTTSTKINLDVLILVDHQINYSIKSLIQVTKYVYQELLHIVIAIK